MNDGTIPHITAVGPPEGNAIDNEAAIAVHLIPSLQCASEAVTTQPGLTNSE
jgi:hypothetical protein